MRAPTSRASAAPHAPEAAAVTCRRARSSPAGALRTAHGAGQCFDVIGRHDFPRDAGGNGAPEVGVDTRRSRRGRLDQDKAFRPRDAGHPGGDAVGGHLPTVRQGIGVPQPPGRRQNRDPATVQSARDRAGAVDDGATFQPFAHQVRPLVHRQDGHPVRRVSARLVSAVDRPHRVGQRAAAGNHQEPPAVCRRPHGPRPTVAKSPIGQRAASHLDNRIDAHRGHHDPGHSDTGAPVGRPRCG